MKINLNGRIMEVKAIEHNRSQVMEAKEKDAVGIVLSNADYESLKQLKGRKVAFSDDGYLATNQ